MQGQALGEQVVPTLVEGSFRPPGAPDPAGAAAKIIPRSLPPPFSQDFIDPSVLATPSLPVKWFLDAAVLF